MKTNFNRIIFIDDDPIHNSIAAQVVRKHLKDIEIEIVKFCKPSEAVKYINKEQADNQVKTIIFLDVDMPVISGWDVLEELALIKESIKNNVIIYMLSSSIDVEDRIEASKNELVTDYFEKPLINHLDKIFSTGGAAIGFWFL